MTPSEQQIDGLVKKRKLNSVGIFLTVFIALQLILAGLYYLLLMDLPIIVGIEVICLVLVVLFAAMSATALKEYRRRLISELEGHKRSSSLNEILEGSGDLIAIDRTEHAQMMRAKDMIIRLNALYLNDLTLDHYFDRVLRTLTEGESSPEFAHILIRDGDGPLKIKAQVGYKEEQVKPYTLEMKESLFYRNCGTAFKHSVIINDLKVMQQTDSEIPLENLLEAPVCSVLSGPIIIHERLVGLITLESTKNQCFSGVDLEIMDFLTDQMAKILATRHWVDQNLYLAKYDQMTGLYNRWQLDEFERNTMPHCLRYKEKFQLVFMGLNNLEAVNDAYGHQMGDLYLIAFAELLKRHSRETDRVFRLSGGTFVAIYFAIDDFTLVGKLEGIEQSLRGHMKAAGVIDLNCHFAYGIASFPEEGQKIIELLTLSEQRMDQKKHEMSSDVRYL